MEPNLGNNINRNSDPRVDFVRNAVDQMKDSSIIINTRYSEAKAATAVLRPVSQHLEFPLSAGKVRIEFAVHLSEFLSQKEYPQSGDFDELVHAFIEGKLKEGVLDYTKLTPQQVTMVSDCLTCCQEIFSQAFSAQQDEFSKETLRSPEQDLQLYFADVKNLDQAYECYNNFLSNETYSDIISHLDTAGQFAAFKVARLAHGVTESAESQQALVELAQLLDLAS
jgi:hypothetical protein